MIGFVNVYKPKGATSFQIVALCKKLFNEKRVGHLGTLDPMAEGVLPIAIGKATKLFDYFLNKDKEYDATFLAGEETDTLDADGTVTATTDTIPTLQEVEKSAQTFFGKIMQMPPKYSAKKINGQRAYDLARKGIDFDLKAKEIEIYGILASNGLDDKLFNLKIWCSSGTYIRSLGGDIFHKINSLSTMTKLVRTRSGTFKIEDSTSIEELKNDPMSHLIGIAEVLKNMTTLTLEETQEKKIKNGCQVSVTEGDGEFLVMNEAQEVLGLGQVEGGKLKLTTTLY